MSILAPLVHDQFWTSMSTLGPQFECPTLTKLGHPCDVQHLNIELGNSVDVMWTSMTGVGNLHEL